MNCVSNETDHSEDAMAVKRNAEVPISAETRVPEAVAFRPTGSTTILLGAIDQVSTNLYDGQRSAMTFKPTGRRRGRTSVAT
jgi:hypothetical protein